MINKILIAEDDKNDIFFISNNLSNLHCSVEVAESLHEAENRAKEFLPDIIILDINLPKTYGSRNAEFSEILTFIRRHKKNHALIVLTGSVDSNQLDEAMDAGAIDYMNKAEISNRTSFETRLRDAAILHGAVLLNEPSALAALNYNHLRASQKVIMLMLKQAKEKVGVVQDKKDELLKHQIATRVIAERDAYWKKRIWALINVGFWGMVYAFKFGFAALRGKH